MSGWDTRRARYGPTGHRDAAQRGERIKAALAKRLNARSEEYRLGYNSGYTAGLKAAARKAEGA